MRNSLRIAGALLLAGAVAACGDDSDGTPPIEINPSALALELSGVELLENSGTQTITLTFDNPAEVEGTINVDLSGTATYGDDYTTDPAAVDGSVALAFAIGESSKTVTITPVDDGVAEEDETIIASATTDIAEFDVAGVSSLTVDLIDVDRLILISSRRDNGALFEVNTTTGELTNIGIATINEEPLRAIRSMAYDPASGTGYFGLARPDAILDRNLIQEGSLYSYDFATGNATLLNDNGVTSSNDFSWRALAGLHVQSGSIYAYTRFNIAIAALSRGGSNNGILQFNTQGDDLNSFIPGSFCCGGGVTSNGTDSLFVGDVGGFQSIDIAAENGTGAFVNLSTTDDGFTDIDVSFSIGDMYLQNLVRDEQGNMYGIGRYVGGGGQLVRANGIATSIYHFLVTINPESGETNYLGTLSEEPADGSNTLDQSVNGLAFVPAYLFRD